MSKNSLITSALKSLTPFQWAEVLAISAISVYFALTDTEAPPVLNIISTAAAICGVLCVILCAAGKRSQYYWGFANIILYVIVSYSNKLYGEVMLNALYYLPTQLIGLHRWKKNISEENGLVKIRRLKPSSTMLIIAATAAGTVLYRFLLMSIGGASPWLDSLSTVVSVTANALMIMRYREQYILWLIVNAVSVIMWARNGDPIMTAMWAIYLFNSFYGYINWGKLSKQPR